MPWIPKPGALRRWRDFRRMTVANLVEKTRGGVKERTIHQLESRRPQGTMRDDTLKMLALALSEKALHIECRPGHLASWRKTDGSIVEIESTPDPTLALAAPRAVADSAPTGPKRRTLTERAELERAIGRHADTIKLPSGTYPLVGLDRLMEIDTTYAEHEGKVFAVAGVPEDTRPIPPRAARILCAESGRGAACFRLTRHVHGADAAGRPHNVLVYATVFAANGEHGKRLMRSHKRGEQVTVLARIVVAEAKKGDTPDERWEGFFIFEPGKPSPKPWAFVVEEVSGTAAQ